MDLLTYVTDQLNKSPWCEITEEQIRTFVPEFAANRVTMNDVAENLVNDINIPLFAGVETFANGETGEHLRVVLIVAKSPSDYVIGRQIVTEKISKEIDGDVVVDMVIPIEEMHQLHQDALKCLKERESGGIPRDTQERTIQDAMFLMQKGVIAVPVKLEAVDPIGVIFTRFIVLVARSDVAKQKMIAQLEDGLAQAPAGMPKGSLTILLH